jgi:hypothetical protein
VKYVIALKENFPAGRKVLRTEQHPLPTSAH